MHPSLNDGTHGWELQWAALWWCVVSVSYTVSLCDIRMEALRCRDFEMQRIAQPRMITIVLPRLFRTSLVLIRTTQAGDQVTSARYSMSIRDYAAGVLGRSQRQRCTPHWGANCGIAHMTQGLFTTINTNPSNTTSWQLDSTCC